MRRIQVPRGAVWNHSTPPPQFSGPRFLALGREDCTLIRKIDAPYTLWSITLGTHPYSVSTSWCNVNSDCILYPPDMWKPHVWEFVHATVEGLAKLGVRVTPMCVRLYREGGGVG